VRDHQSFDRVASGYDLVATLEGPEKNEVFLSRLPEARDAALDVGCGSGVLAGALAERFGRVVGIDISDEMLAIARAKRSAPNLTYLAMDAEQLELDGTFDFICSANTFHHFLDQEAATQALKERLNPGGRLVVLDNLGLVRFGGTPPAWFYLLTTLAGAPRALRRFGIANSLRLARFQLSREWLSHLASDRYLRPDEFRALYGRTLPGCKFHRVGVFMVADWTASTV
jgi:ubiquinone/menaquinone biosynthesis C-methylase UbiE